MSTNIEQEMPKDKTTLLISFLKQCVEFINSKYGVNMCLYQPGLEPLSLIEKKEQEILAELHNNIVIMLCKFNFSGSISLSDWDFKPFFGVEKDELKKIAGRLVALLPITQLKDDEFEKQLIAIEAKNHVNEILDGISQNMLASFIKEYYVLFKDFQNFTITTEKTSDNSTVAMASSQTLSNYFRIMYKDNSNCYCTIADAITDNQVQKGARKI